MATNSKLNVLTRNAALAQVSTDIGASGNMRWYDGTQPTDADTALSSNTLIVTLPLSATMGGTPSAGSMTVNAITSANAAATGNPVTFGSFLTSGNVRKLDFNISTSAANLNLNSVTVGSGASCSVTSFTVTMAA